MSAVFGSVRRHLLRVLLIVGLVVAAGLVSATPASADICQDAPAPVAPKSGLPGMLTSVPRDVPDSAPDPFKNPKVPIGDVYGYNWGWSNFDLGCGSDFLRDPVAVTNTKSANVVMALLGGVLAGLSSLEGMAKTSSLDWLTTVVAGVADKLKGPLLGAWLPLGVLGVGLVLVYRARRASYADTLRAALIIGGAVGMATFALVYPATASKAVDSTVVAVSDAVGKQFSASASDAVSREGAYRTWLTGNFGDPDSAVSRDLGPRLLSATRYTWSDMKRIQADPGAKKRIDQAKAGEFKAVAKEIKDRDPAAYEVFTGRGERTAPALLGVLVVLCMGLFIALAMLMVLIARVMMQGLALAAPLAAVLGVLPTHTSVLARLWDLFTAAVVAVAKFVVAGGIMALVLGAIQANSGLGAGSKLFWVIVATVVGIVLTRPVRSFKTIVPGLNPDRSYLRAAANGAAAYIGARLGTEEGAEAGIRGSFPNGTANESVGQATQRSTASADDRESLEPLPMPAWSYTTSADPVWTQTAPATRGAVEATTTSAGQWARGQTWPGVVAGGRGQRELPAAPLRPSASLAMAPDETDIRATADALSPSVHAGSGPGLGGPRFVAPLDPALVSSDTVMDAPVVGMGGPPAVVTNAGSVPVDPALLRRPRVPAWAEGVSEVVYPSGIIVAAEEHSLYQRNGNQGSEASEVYVTLPEPELAEDGTEHEMVTYFSSAGTSHGSA